ncbi:cytochrome-c peroxidase [Pedobacter sp. KBW06]|uniref:cytochrome-c peroxidase n=1 Tax=Pedobacter sp. KBW06 TaxID=2153359 RepID=UPI000F5B7E75|nr:cytochrome c peroxidase [Pedobacter sp. KBW06]RQO74066.1 cytochrome-c peroxidase [Pedobacter sp. KBW06]
MKYKVISLLFLSYILLISISFKAGVPEEFLKSLRAQYEKDPKEWPKPEVDSGIVWKELAAMTYPGNSGRDSSSIKKAQLGKLLFFDPRLSSSNQISCSSCHDPEMSWTDGRKLAIGHDHQSGIRNTPSIQNLAENRLFLWDGRRNTLSAQAREAMANPVEMHVDLDQLPAKIRKIKGYKVYFEQAFGKGSKYGEEQILESIAAFVAGISSRPTRFDNFMKGRKRALSDQQIWGLHLFRTKARCINCHNGAMFNDGEFHNLGFSNYGKPNQDLGLYNISGNPADIGKFKTPSLRDVMRTSPWFHDGRFNEMEALINMYTAGMPQPKPRVAQIQDPNYPKSSPHLKKLDINLEERAAIISFLTAITTAPLEFKRPELPSNDLKQ